MKLSAEYEAKQKELTAFVKTEQVAVHSHEQDKADFYSFTAVIHHAPDKSTGRRRQKIQIVWNFIGEASLPNDEQTVERQRKSKTA